MYFVVSIFDIKPDWVRRWPELTREFTEATRAEDGNLFFEWSQNLAHPERFTLVEAFRDDAVAAHLESPEVPKIIDGWRPALARDPYVLQAAIDRDWWDVMPFFDVAGRNDGARNA